MKPEQVIAAVQQILQKQVSAPPVAGVSQLTNESVERLVLMVTAFFSLEDPKMRDAIIAEAQNRVILGGVIGKRPWEVG